MHVAKRHTKAFSIKIPLELLVSVDEERGEREKETHTWLYLMQVHITKKTSAAMIFLLHFVVWGNKAADWPPTYK